jgi:hypothetical protein
MQQDVFGVLAQARRLEDLQNLQPKARKIYVKYRDELEDAEMKDLAICRRVSRLNYSRRCAEASAVQSHVEKGIALYILVCR